MVDTLTHALADSQTVSVSSSWLHALAFARVLRKNTDARLALVLDRAGCDYYHLSALATKFVLAGMEMNDLRVQEHAAKELQRAAWPHLQQNAVPITCFCWRREMSEVSSEERTHMAREDEAAKEERSRERIRSLGWQLAEARAPKQRRSAKAGA